MLGCCFCGQKICFLLLAHHVWAHVRQTALLAFIGSCSCIFGRLSMYYICASSRRTVFARIQRTCSLLLAFQVWALLHLTAFCCVTSTWQQFYSALRPCLPAKSSSCIWPHSRASWWQSIITSGLVAVSHDDIIFDSAPPHGNIPSALWPHPLMAKSLRPCGHAPSQQYSFGLVATPPHSNIPLALPPCPYMAIRASWR